MHYSKILSVALVSTTLLSGCDIKLKPITAEARLASMMQDQAEMFAHQEPITTPLSFYDALARALKYNLENRLTLMEAALQDTQLDIATLNMLPRLTASAGYLVRQSELASSSESVQTRKESLEASTSQDTARGVADLAFSWNILDFGVSYFQAQQQADRLLIAKERRRKVVNNLVKEVLAAYWSANIADRLLPKLEPVLAQAEQALTLSKTIENDRLQPVLSVLEYQRSLLGTIDQLRKLKADLIIAKPKLASLINAPIHTDFALATADQTPEPPRLQTTPSELENLGLFLRPDLREEMYQERISRVEAWKEILKVMPGLTIPLSANWDGNSFLVHQLWIEAGARTTFNLINLLAAPKIWQSAETQIEVAITRRKAMSIAALVQINIGYQQYIKALDGYQNATALNKIDQSIYKVVSDSTENDTGSDLERIHAATAELASQLQKEQSLSDVYGALGNIYASIGLDPAVGAVEYVSVRALSVQLEKTISRWYAGHLPKLPKPTTASSAKAKAKIPAKKPVKPQQK